MGEVKHKKQTRGRAMWPNYAGEWTEPLLQLFPDVGTTQIMSCPPRDTGGRGHRSSPHLSPHLGALWPLQILVYPYPMP